MGEVKLKMGSLTDKFEEVQLVYRNKTKAEDRPQIKNPDDAYDVLLKSWNKDEINLCEEFKIMLLDNQMRVMSLASVSKGGITGTAVDPRIAFAIALKRRATRLIMAHNHPSGSIKASPSDLELTKAFIKAGKILQIPVEDHIIVTENDFCSIFIEHPNITKDP